MIIIKLLKLKHIQFMAHFSYNINEVIKIISIT